MTKLAAAKSKADELRKTLRELDKITGRQGEREVNAERMRAKRDATRIVVIPKCADPERRELLESDDPEWLRWYCGDLFWYAFTEQQRAMIEAIGKAIVYGGDQALAASRGEGKTKLAERLLLKYTLQGRLNFSVLFAATGSKAEDSLKSLREEIEINDRLHDDYPEVCVPVRALENTPNRAHYQKVSGFRHDDGSPYEAANSKFTWCGHEIIFPNVPGSPSAKAIIATRGLDAEVRGLNKGNRRPQLAVIDDPDTEDTVRSEEQAKKLKERIDRGIGGLGGQKRRIARVMLTTLQRRDCVSAWYTDPLKEHSWKGKRFRYLLKPPDRTDHWEEYIQLWKSGMLPGEDGQPVDPFARQAFAFLMERYEAMHAGAAVANPHRFDDTILPDGTQLEVSSLQSYYNFVAINSPEAAQAELDNDPPEETGPVPSGISPQLIQKQLNKLPKGTIPKGCVYLTIGIDVGKWRIHFVVRAWMPDGTGYTIDYGYRGTYGAKYKSDEGLDRAIHEALIQLFADLREACKGEYQGDSLANYLTEDGQPISDPLIVVDASYRTDAVYAACSQAGMGVYPIMGCGKSAGCIHTNFSDQLRATRDKKPGDGWFLTRRKKPPLPDFWLIYADTDRWKAWEHDRWMSARDRPGCLWLWGQPSEDPVRLSPDERDHGQYALQVCAEVEVEEVVKGSIKRRWKPSGSTKDNHYLDASYYSDVAAAIKGVRVLTGEVKKDAGPRASLSDLAAKARNR